jgi:hypothetical protein
MYRTPNIRHSRESGNLCFGGNETQIPAFAGMTIYFGARKFHLSDLHALRPEWMIRMRIDGMGVAVVMIVQVEVLIWF